MSRAGAKKSKGRTYGFFGPLLTVMIMALVLAFAGLIFELSAHISSQALYYGSAVLLVNVSIFAAGIIISLLIFYFFLRESVNFAVKIAVSIFIFTTVVASLIYLRLFLGSYGFSSPVLHFMLSIVAYLGSFLGVLAVFDVLSKSARNLLFAACSGILGAFIGVLIPTLAMIMMVVLLAIIDVIATSRQTVKHSKKVIEDYESLVILKLSYAGRNWAIGIGDLVSYSILVANSYANFGLVVGVSSLVLILVGSFITSKRARRLAQVSGLPIAVGLGLVPVLLYMFLTGLP